MRWSITVLLVLIWTLGAAPAQAQTATIRTQIEVSEVLSLYYFAEAAAGVPNRSDQLRALWAQHADDKARQGLERFRAALSAAPNSVRYYGSDRDRPTSRYVGTNVSAIIEGHAGAARTLDDFGERVTGLFPVAAHSDFITGLRAMAHVHREHVWRPSQKFLPAKLRELRRLADKTNVAEQLARVARFYGSPWPADVPIRIYLVGVPGERNRTKAHSSGAIEVAEVLQDDDPRRRLSVLFHELCHSLYAAQPLERQMALEQAWNNHPLPAARIAYAQANEGLATALGNGWFEGLLRNEPQYDQSWYADEIVDGFAKTLYPLIVHYLDSGQAMDASFVNFAVARFVWRFPHVHESPRALFRQVVFATTRNLDVGALGLSFRRTFGTNGMWSSQPLDHENSVQQYHDHKLTAVMIVHPDHVDELAPYSSQITAGFDPSKRPRLIRVHHTNGRAHVLISAASVTDAEAAFQRLAAQKRLTDGMVLTYESN